MYWRIVKKEKKKKEESWANGIFYPKSHLCLKKLFCPLHFFFSFPNGGKSSSSGLFSGVGDQIVPTFILTWTYARENFFSLFFPMKFFFAVLSILVETFCSWMLDLLKAAK